MAGETGLNFRHFNGMTGKMYLPEIMGSGAALFDFDGDGDLDVFLVQGKVLEPGAKAEKAIFPFSGQGEPRGVLFRNDLEVEKDGSRRLRFTDVTEKSGIRTVGYGFGVAVGDINNDGFPDLYICNLESNTLWLNNKNGTFTDVTEKSRTDDPRWSTGATFFDYDLDGWLDLAVINYAGIDLKNHPDCFSPTTEKDYCGPRSFKAVGNSLFHNRGDGTFENVTGKSGIDREFGHALGIVSADFNDDGFPDLYIANDGDANQLWVNRKNGTFSNESLLAGTAFNRNGQAEASMGVDANDFDGNGEEDIFTTHLMEETHTLYKNFGDLIFEDRTREAGIGAAGSRFTGFGTMFFDYDNDGKLDLFIANGSVRILPELQRKGDSFPLGQPNQLYKNTGEGKLTEIKGSELGVLQNIEVSRGASFGDVDNDGDTDILVVNNNGPARLLLNQVGAKNHWLGLRLIGEKINRDAIGTKVEFVLEDGAVLRRRIRTDGSYGSAHDPRILLGLGQKTKIKMIRVKWIDGKVEQLTDPPFDKYLKFFEGQTK
ncbi:MAG: CRTAC1 family protein [Pyrinomonadaceae bacterium]